MLLVDDLVSLMVEQSADVKENSEVEEKEKSLVDAMVGKLV